MAAPALALIIVAFARTGPTRVTLRAIAAAPTTAEVSPPALLAPAIPRPRRS